MSQTHILNDQPDSHEDKPYSPLLYFHRFNAVGNLQLYDQNIKIELLDRDDEFDKITWGISVRADKTRQTFRSQSIEQLRMATYDLAKMCILMEEKLEEDHEIRIARPEKIAHLIRNIRETLLTDLKK